MTSAIRARREAEDGFTLIELLVVVIIIGILAAIAIPAFLNQRERAWQAELTSGVRNTALELEAEGTQLGGVYPATASGDTLAEGFVTTESGAPGATGSPIANVIYIGTYDNGGVVTEATTQTPTGFYLCMEHASINGDNSIAYVGGTAGSGLTDFEEATCAANSNDPA